MIKYGAFLKKYKMYKKKRSIFHKGMFGHIDAK